MTFGLGKNLYIGCVASFSAILLVGLAAVARPQDQPAANPDPGDPYSAVEQKPDPSAPQKSTDPISEPAQALTPDPTPMDSQSSAVSDPIHPQVDPVVNYPSPERAKETPTQLSQDDSIVRNNDGEIIEIESYPEENLSTDQSSTSNKWSRSYRDRRGSWGTLLSVGYSLYTPENYVPNFGVNQSYQDYYGSAAPGMPEVSLIFKKNFSLGSFGLGLKGGSFTVSGNGATLNIVPIKLGATYFMDAMSADPRFVPYIGGGAFTGIYTESLSGQSINGNSPFSYYYNIGIEMQLNWLDEYGSRYSYEDFGMENAFVFLEAEGTGSSDDTAADLSNPFYLTVGFRMEF